MEAGTERRKEFAWKHLKKFGGFAIIFLMYSVISYLLKISCAADGAIGTIGMCVLAFSTIKIKL